MLYIEDNIHDHTDDVSFNIMSEELQQYDKETLTYHIQILKDGELIKDYAKAGYMGIISVNDLTWKGHQYLDNIREDHIWKAVKEKASKVGSVSLQVMIPLATAIIQQKLGLS
jgi:predicted transcriptional regulator